MHWGLTTPLWLLGFALGGWLLGLLAVCDRRWAWVPAVTTGAVLGSGVLMPTLGWLPNYQGRLSVPIGFALLLALLLLLVRRVPDVRVRAGIAALVVPLAAYHLLLLTVFLFFLIFQIS